MKKNKLIELRKRLALLSMLGVFSLTGCSKEMKPGETKIITTVQDGKEVKNNVFDFDNVKYTGLEDGKYLYNYLLDLSNNSYEEINDLYGKEFNKVKFGPSRADFASLIEDEHIEAKTANDSGWKKINAVEEWLTFPEDLQELNGTKIDSTRFLDAQKFITMDGKTIFSLKYKRVFNETKNGDTCFIEKGTSINLDVVFESIEIYGKYYNIPLYLRQYGVGENSKNVQEHNINCSNEVIMPLENTVFKNMNGEYSYEYLIEALDTYVGGNMIEYGVNRDIDFSEYKKVR